jgi:toxin ParE1/3/4
MKRQLRLTEQAQQDLRDIWRGLAEFGSLESADGVLRMIQKKFKILVQFPGSGRIREELEPGLRSFPAHVYVIFYRIGDGQVEVEIVRIIHGRRDIEAIFTIEES